MRKEAGLDISDRIALRYAGIYPDTVARLVAIEGLGPPPRVLAERGPKPIAERMDDWIREQHAGRSPQQLVAEYDASYDRLIEGGASNSQALQLMYLHQKEARLTADPWAIRSRKP